MRHGKYFIIMLNADTEQAVNLQIMTVRKHIYFSGRVQGEESTIRKLLIQLRGQRYIRIEHMEIEDIEPETEKGFGVTGW